MGSTLVEPHTTIHYYDGSKEVGRCTRLKTGDHIYYTATADQPELGVQKVWTMLMFELELMSYA